MENTTNKPLKKIEVVNFILLKIQSQEWNTTEPIPSERWLAIKFKVSKSLISNILANMKAHNILYSVKNKGYYISKTTASLLYSKSSEGVNTNISLNTKWRFSNSEKKFCKTLEEKHKLCWKDFLSKYSVHEKVYLNNKGEMFEKVVVIFPDNPDYHLENAESILKKSVFTFTAILGLSLGNMITTEKISYNLEQSKIGDKYFENFPDYSIVRKTYKIFKDHNNEVKAMIKIIKIVEPNNYESIFEINII